MGFARVLGLVRHASTAWLLACFVTAAPLCVRADPSLQLSIAAPVDLQRSLVEHLNRPLKDFTVTEYGPREGAPGQVNVIAQTSDGLLWLGCPDGLVRFDGVTFDRPFNTTLPQQNISALWVDPDGSLWVGYTFGGISRLHESQISDLSNGLPDNTVYSIVRDADKTLWATTPKGVYYLSGAKWEQIGPQQGYEGNSYFLSMGLLRDGSLWIDGGPHAWMKKPGKPGFVPVEPKKLLASIYNIDDTNKSGKAHDLIEELSNYFEIHPRFVNGKVIEDSSGSIWSLTSDALDHFRWTTQASNEKSLSSDSLARQGTPYGEAINALFEDREGNIWAGEIGGLLQFRPSKLRTVESYGKILAPTIAPDLHGGVWIGSSKNDGVMSVNGDVETPWPSLHGATSFIASGNDETTWLLSRVAFNTPYKSAGCIHRLKEGKIDCIAYPDDVDPRSAVSMLPDPRGGYIFLSIQGIYRFMGNAWLPGTGLPGLAQAPPLRMFSGENGDIWFTYPDNHIAVITKSGVRNYTAANGLSIGAILALSVQHGDVWAAGTKGVEHLLSQQFVPLRSADPTTFASADGIAQTAQGDLWINASSGLFLIKHSELKFTEKDPTHKVSVELFDQNDGLLGGTIGFRSGPSLVQSGGRIWAARAQGVSWVDPGKMIRNEIAPVAVVVSIASDGILHGISPAPRFPALVHAVRFMYTAASLTRPDKVNFRYRLEGSDPDWITVGDRRATTYTDLRPGTYQFEVEAENEDGVWSVRPSVASFTIAPAFYQTGWFKTLCMASLLLALWGLFAWRSKRLRARVHSRLEAVHDERDRIARELHDTLMQSMQGLILQIQAWSQDGLDRRHLEMERAANSATTALREGRERILALRLTSSDKPNLLSELRKAGEYWALRVTSVFDIRVKGEFRELQTKAFEEIVEIAREAIRNAAIHSKACHILVALEYASHALTLTVSDDGEGLPAYVLAAGILPGHWGLVGMKERAKALEAKLSLHNRPQGGAEMKLVVPCKQAYGKEVPSKWAIVKRTY
nr:sensor histidine kinase [Rhodanobacter sp. ANJX3]